MTRDEELLVMLGNPSPSELQFVANKLATDYGIAVDVVAGQGDEIRFDNAHQTGKEAVKGYIALKLEQTRSEEQIAERENVLRRMFEN